jgi:hypothetical protein
MQSKPPKACAADPVAEHDESGAGGDIALTVARQTRRFGRMRLMSSS